MGAKLIYSLSFTFCLEMIIGLSGNTCTIGDRQVCCPNFESVNGICKKCQNGFTSEKNGNCSKCNQGLYGHKCAKSCIKCSFDRCDHIKGCVQRTSTAETTLNDLTLSTSVLLSTSQTDSVTVNDDTRLTANRTILSTSHPGSAPVNDNNPTKSSTEIIIYCASVGCLLLVMCLGFAYQRYRLKQQSKTLLQLTKVHSMNLLTEEILTGNEEEHYQYIDESRMVDSKVDLEPSGGYLEVVDSSSDASFQQNIDGGYLHPYNALTDPTEAEVHVYLQKDNIKHKSISSGSNASLPYTDQQGYFHMYHQLGKRCKSLPRDYESTTPYSHDYSLNRHPDGEENKISGNSKTLYEQQHIVERTQPQCIQEAKQLLLMNKGLFSHAQNTSSDHQMKKNLTL